MSTVGEYIFTGAEKLKSSVSQKESKRMQQLYQQWANDIDEKANKLSRKANKSARLQVLQQKQLESQIKASSKELMKEVNGDVVKSLYEVADSVVSSNNEWLTKLGFNKELVNMAFSNVPKQTVENLIYGKVYKNGWNLSKRIWGDNEDTLKDIYSVIAGGLAKNQSIYETAKDVSKYVDPTAKKDWNLTMADGKKIYPKQVDYNSQRLARTLVQHTYQQSFVATTRSNPLIKEYIWRANGSRPCDICQERDGKHYKKNELPLDHPQGQCTMVPVVASDYREKIKNWLDSPEGTDKELDKFAEKLGYVPKASELTEVQDKFLSYLGYSSTNLPKDFDDWFEKAFNKSIESGEFRDDLEKVLKDGGYISSDENFSIYKRSEIKKWYNENMNVQEPSIKNAVKSSMKDGTTPRQMSYINKVNDITESQRESISDAIGKYLNEHKEYTESEFTKQLNDKFSDIVSNSDFGMRIRSDNLEKVLDEGRFKNQFETNRSGGFYNPSARKEVENSLFNVPKTNTSITDSDRPVYGIMLPKYDSKDSAIKSYYRFGPGSFYGDGVTVIFDKSKVINNATLTIGDSLDYRSKVVATLANDPKVNGSYNNEFLVNNLADSIKQNKSASDSLFGITGGSDRYLEYQLHGSISHSADNIKEVILTGSKEDYSKSLIEKLENKKIKIEFIKYS